MTNILRYNHLNDSYWPVTSLITNWFILASLSLIQFSALLPPSCPNECWPVIFIPMQNSIQSIKDLLPGKLFDHKYGDYFQQVCHLCWCKKTIANGWQLTNILFFWRRCMYDDSFIINLSKVYELVILYLFWIWYEFEKHIVPHKMIILFFFRTGQTRVWECLNN
jgi:hypothetical protein